MIRTAPSIVTLALIAAVSPLAMNVYLPSLPAIADDFNTPTSSAQLTVSIYLAATAIAQLIIGPLSDKFGRRPVMLWGLAIMIAATFICIYAPTIEVLWLGRILQASCAAGVVLSRAIARDMVEGSEAASMIGYITMGMTLAPMLGPVFGGFLDEWYGWQSSFWVLIGFASFVFVVCWFDMGETNKNMDSKFSDQLRAYPELISSRRFLGYCATLGLTASTFFVYLGAAPILSDEFYGMSPSTFGFYFVFIACGYMIGNFISGRYSTRFGINPMMFAGCLVVAAGLLIALGFYALNLTHPVFFFGMTFFVGIGHGMTLPNANGGVVNLRPQIAGAASGLAATFQIACGSGFAAFSFYAFSPGKSVLTLLLLMLVTVLGAILATLYVIYIEKSVENEQA